MRVLYTRVETGSGDFIENKVLFKFEPNRVWNLQKI
jgi:hypothetical protein